MSAPGEALVVRAARSGNLSVRMSASLPGGSNHAHLVLERISATAPQAALAVPRARPFATDIELLAHVARRGDVVSQGGEWICGPDLPMAIEGVEVRWPGKPHDIDIVVSGGHLVQGRNRSLQTVSSGVFFGSRGRAAPITSLSLAIVGSSASAYLLDCQALFLGAQVLGKSGIAIDLAGPTRLEPLVGLRLTLKPAKTRPAEISPEPTRLPIAMPEPLRSNPVYQLAGSSGRVRVFRTSRSRQLAN